MKTAVLLLYCSIAAVLYMPQAEGQSHGRITIQTEPVVRRVGSHGVLNCTVNSPPGSSDYVEWYFLSGADGGYAITRACRTIVDHNLINGIEKYQIHCGGGTNGDDLYSLRINLLSIPDNGEYQCRVRQDGSPNPVDTMTVNLTVLSPPKMIYSASDISKDSFIGRTVDLKCYAEGIPAPNVTWGSASGRPLPPNNRSIARQLSRTATQTVQQLTIYNVSKDDRGTYRCSADNNIRPPDDLFARLSIEFPPSVSPVEPNYGTAVGENTKAMLWCQVAGDPRPTMGWYALSREESELFKKGSLTIDEAFIENLRSIITDSKYKVEQKIMTVGSLSTMESMFYSLTIQTVEAIDLVYYICRAENTHGSEWAIVQLYAVNSLVGEINSPAPTVHCTGSTLLALFVTLSVVVSRHLSS